MVGRARGGVLRIAGARLEDQLLGETDYGVVTPHRFDCRGICDSFLVLVPRLQVLPHICTNNIFRFLAHTYTQLVILYHQYITY